MPLISYLEGGSTRGWVDGTLGKLVATSQDRSPSRTGGAEVRPCFGEGGRVTRCGRLPRPVLAFLAQELITARSDHVHGRSLYTGSAQSTTGLSALVTIGLHAVRSRATHDLWSHAEGA